MEELKECPFCGEKKELSEHEFDAWPEDIAVRCDNCGALGPPCSTWPRAQIAWNKRQLISQSTERDKVEAIPCPHCGDPDCNNPNHLPF